MNSPWNCLPQADSSSTSCMRYMSMYTTRNTYYTKSLSLSSSHLQHTYTHTQHTHTHRKRKGEREKERKLTHVRSHEVVAALLPLSFFLSLFFSVSRFLPSFPACRRSVTGFSVGTGLLLRGIHVSLLLLRTWLAYVQAGTTNVEGGWFFAKGQKGGRRENEG